LAPGLAAANPGAQELLCKLVLAVDPASGAVGGGGAHGFAAQWLRSKLSGPGRAQEDEQDPSAGALSPQAVLHEQIHGEHVGFAATAFEPAGSSPW